MGREGRLAGVPVGAVRFRVGGVGRQRYLRVDDHLFVAGQQKHHVGAHVGALLGAEVFLHAEVDPFLQAGTFEQGFEDHFAPVALRLAVAAQGGGQVVGLAAHLVARFVQPPDFGFQHFALGGFLFDALAEFFEILAEGSEQVADVLPVGFGETFGFVFQNVVRKVLEIIRKLFFEFSAFGGLGFEPFRPDADFGSGFG